MDRDQQETLLKTIQQLSPVDRAAVQGFAEFLLSRSGSGGTLVESAPARPPEIPEPDPQPRPQDEKVVAAVKRLSKTYFMLDKTSMLGVTSDLVTQHVLQRREASEVIDELEQLFANQYRKLKQGED